jgi:hypothetical protein
MPLPDASRKYRYTYSHFSEGTREMAAGSSTTNARGRVADSYRRQEAPEESARFFKILPSDIVTINDEIDFCGRTSSH